MVVIHGRSKRKPSGARYRSAFTKRLAQRGNKPTHTKVDENQAKSSRTKGGGVKVRLLSANKINLYDPSTKKHSIESIKTVAENTADRHFVRHNIMTKGAVVMTPKGKARITNRPGQEGVINAILIK
ncbi:MAG: 30S ribosomal protein S8e [archaeon]